MKFDRRFPRQDRFRDNIESGHGGRAEAALAWVVEGAKKWYANGKSMPDAPAKVQKDTSGWRGENDLFVLFMSEGYLVPDPGRAVERGQLLEVFGDWMKSRGQIPWGAPTLNSRMERHEGFAIEKDQLQTEAAIREVLSLHPTCREPQAKKPAVWRGLRWADELLRDEL